MDAYTSFASVYDTFMDNVPYSEWASYISEYLRANKVDDGLILDLGCGTGKLTRELESMGYDMIGIDLSEEMLEIARSKSEASQMQGNGILYLCQDMREFELYGTVRGVVSACDSMNYITEPEELLEVFLLVSNYLDPGGFFIFDMNTPHQYKDVLAQNTFAENREDCSFIWDNYYDDEEGINEYELSLFIRQQGDFYRRYNEIHYERCYSKEEVESLLERAGLELLGCFDGYSDRPVRSDSERMLFIAKEKHHEGKLYI